MSETTILDGRTDPLFALGLGMAPVIAGTTTFASALVLGVGTFLVVNALDLASRAIKGRVFPQAERYALYVCDALLVTLLALALRSVFPFTYSELSMYVWLLAFNGIVTIPTVSFGNDPSQGAKVLSLSAKFLLALLAYGLVRELVGQGGFSLPSADGSLQFKLLPPGFLSIRFMMYPAGALILFGYLGALSRRISGRTFGRGAAR